MYRIFELAHSWFNNSVAQTRVSTSFKIFKENEGIFFFSKMSLLNKNVLPLAMPVIDEKN